MDSPRKGTPTASNGKLAATRSTRSSGKAKKIQNLAEINKAHRAKIQSTSSKGGTPSTPVKREESPEPCTSTSQVTKRKSTSNEDRLKRQRQQTQPFQSTPTTSASSTTKAPKEKIEQMIIYNRGDYLAIRNEFNQFFLCRARQNIYKNGSRIKISWYNDDIKKGEYIPDFDDDIDFETILTNVRINRIDHKRIELPEAEHQRVINILQRAIGVEQGIHEAPDPTKVLGDGLDISILGKEDELMKKVKQQGEKNTKSKKSNAQSNGIKTSQTNGINSKDTNGVVHTENGPLSPINIKADLSFIENSSTSILSTKNPNKRGGETSLLFPSTSTPFRTRTRKFTTAPGLETTNGQTSNGQTSNGQTSHTNDLTSSTLDNTLPMDTSATIIIVDEQVKDLMFDSKTHLPFISLVVNSKLLIRAVLFGDHEGLSGLLEGGQLCSVSIPRSVCIRRNALHYSLLNEDFVSMTRLLKVNPETLAEKTPKIQSMELLHSELTLDQDNYQSENLHLNRLDSSYAKFAIKHNVSLDFIQNALGYFQNGLADFTDNLVFALKSGNFPMASFLAKELVSSNSPDFNSSHLMYFEPWDASRAYIFTTMNDWSIGRHKIAPLHLAAINPDPFLFTSIVHDSMDKLNGLTDDQGWTCLHYAAVCSTFFNLQYLLSFGVSTLCINSKGNSPLHLAVSANRLENVALIVSEEKLHSASGISLKAYNAHGWTPLHIACKRGYAPIVRYFIENNVQLDIVTSTGSGELTPLMIACQYGHLGIVKLLIENGANVNTFDKKNRCPLTYAVKNGHSHLVSCLLKCSANPSCKDMFGNNLFHYALAYGWFFCYEILLMQTNGNLRDTNMFGLTPMCVAFMKGHVGIIEDILKRGLLSVNAPVNDSGITLTMLAFSLPPSESLLKHLKLFVETFRCDLSKTDYSGNNTLHYFLQCESKYKCQSSPQVSEVLQSALKIISKCDPYVNNNAGVSPLAYAIQNDCFITFLHYFKDNPKCPRLLNIINGNERFWRLVINHLLEVVPSDKVQNNKNEQVEGATPLTFSRFLMNTCNESKLLMSLLTKMSLKTNKNGELPIEFYIKSARQVLKSNTSKLSREVVDKEMTDFLRFLSRFYDFLFMQELGLLHLAAKYSTSALVRSLLKMAFSVELVDQHGNSPLVMAIVCRNHETATELLNSGADPSSTYLKENISSFLYELKYNNTSYEFIPHFSKYFKKYKEVDGEGNNALHLLARKINVPFSVEAAAILMDKINVNNRNKHGETPLHIALRENSISPQLIAIFDLFVKKEADLYIKDENACTPLNYLMEKSGSDPQLLRIFQLIDTKNFNLVRHADVKEASLLFNCAEMGNAACLSYLKVYMDCNKTDIRKLTPLAAATINGHKDCAQILIRSDFEIRSSDFVTGIRNSDFPDPEDSKVNLFALMMKNGWKDLLFEILDKAKSNKRLLEFLHCLLKNNCIEFAIPAIKIAKNTLLLERHTFKSLLNEFSKSTTCDVSKDLQIEFLQQFPEEIVSESYVEVFINSLTNWNYILCQEVLAKMPLKNIISNMHRERRFENPIALVFIKVFNEDTFVEQMKELIELFLGEGIDINCFWKYPIFESGQREEGDRYTHCRNIQNTEIVPYTPLIVAVIKGNYHLVKWLLNIKHKDGHYLVDVNFGDSLQRTPLMHAIMKNDLKMIKLLLDRNYEFEQEKDVWSNQTPTTQNVNQVNLLARDIYKRHLFSFPILPLDYFNYAKGDFVFKFLWNLVDESHKNSDLVNELYKVAASKNITNIISLLEEIESDRLTVQKVGETKLTFAIKPVCSDLLKDHENRMIEYMKSPRTIRVNKKDILQCETTGIAYDTTLTKLDNQQDQYIFNFYKLQIFKVFNKFALVCHWGRIGTKGNINKVFFDEMQEAVDEFKRIFAHKSGQVWNDVYKEEGVNSSVTLQRNRMMEFSKTCKYMSYDTDMKSPEYAAQSELAFPLKELINRWIRFQDKSCTYTRSPAYGTLNSKVLEDCQEILLKIYDIILKNKLSLRDTKKCSLKYMYEIINLSEDFYSQMVIYGNDFDQQPPITSLTDLLEKAQTVHRLRGLIYGRELIHLASKVEERNPVDYLYDSFRFELLRLTIDSQESLFMHLFLRNSFHFKFFLTATYRVIPRFEFETTKHSYLLWYSLDHPYIFQTLVKGIQPEPISYPNSHVILQGIKLTNDLKYTKNHSDKLKYYILCEAKLDRVLRVDEGSSIDDCSLDQYDAIVTYPNNVNANYVQHYMSWKGYTVPFRKDHHPGPSEFIILNSHLVTPRYLIELRSVPPY